MVSTDGGGDTPARTREKDEAHESTSAEHQAVYNADEPAGPVKPTVSATTPRDGTVTDEIGIHIQGARAPDPYTVQSPDTGVLERNTEWETGAGPPERGRTSMPDITRSYPTGSPTDRIHVTDDIYSSEVEVTTIVRSAGTSDTAPRGMAFVNIGPRHPTRRDDGVGEGGGTPPMSTDDKHPAKGTDPDTLTTAATETTPTFGPGVYNSPGKLQVATYGGTPTAPERTPMDGTTTGHNGQDLAVAL